jgi:hypothetical protein
MVGANDKKQLPIAVVKSTPSTDKAGAMVKLTLAKLSKYKVNIRVFRPNKNFEFLGFRFHGDNRGFSTAPSWFGKSTGGPTSRIWQRYELNLDTIRVGNLTKDLTAKLGTESNFSGPGPGIWSIFSWGGQDYEKAKYKPRGTLNSTEVEVPHDAQKIVRIKSHLAGENHAFLTSELQQNVAGKTIVPTLDAWSEVFIRVERVKKYIDISSITYGDGFPNCESFIVDSTGKELFLGSHVRIGYPATHLWFEKERLIWSNAIRIEIDENGNFGERLWVFAQVLGGPPNLRDEYPATASFEICSKNPNERKYVSGSRFPEAEKRFVWDCGATKAVVDKNKTELPIYLSAHKTSISEVRSLVDQTWIIGPKKRTTRSDWNDYHRHRDPNAGRAKDDAEYQISDEKWKK